MLPICVADARFLYDWLFFYYMPFGAAAELAVILSPPLVFKPHFGLSASSATSTMRRAASPSSAAGLRRALP